jgi:Fe-S-cluster-containing hydrogenase component 2
VTHSIGQGRAAGGIIHAGLAGAQTGPETTQVIPPGRIRPEYYEACRADTPVEKLGDACLSCGKCRDCKMCETTCYRGAISRLEHKDGSYEYVVDEDKCIGCGFCAGICPCGIWEMIENI